MQVKTYNVVTYAALFEGITPLLFTAWFLAVASLDRPSPLLCVQFNIVRMHLPRILIFNVHEQSMAFFFTKEKSSLTTLP